MISEARRKVGQHQARTELAARLLVRREEIEQAVLARICAIGDLEEVSDPEYLSSLRAAVFAALDYWIAGIEYGDMHALPIPADLLSHARISARNVVAFDTVLRRYCAGHTLFVDFIIDEVQTLNTDNKFLKGLLRSQASRFEYLLAKISEEYSRTLKNRAGSSQVVLTERIRRLLSGEPLDLHDLRYDFESKHLGAIAKGMGAAGAVRALAREVDSRLLLVPVDEQTVWAWFDIHHVNERRQFRCSVDSSWPRHLLLSLGEPAATLVGWRLTHRQASMALPFTDSGTNVISYADVALLASMQRDATLTSSLHQLYLAPLAQRPRRSPVLKETLRAYFEADRNAASAAALLHVSRQTINNRLKEIEDRLDQPIRSCAWEIEAALRLEDIGRI